MAETITAPTMTIGDKTPLLIDLTKDSATSRGVLGDLCGANYAIKGSCWGYGLSSDKKQWNDPSMCGVFTNTAGDAITVVWDSSKYFNIIIDQLQVRYDNAVLFYKKEWLSSESAARGVAMKIGARQATWDASTTGNGWAEEAATELKVKIPWILGFVDDEHKRLGRKVNILVVLHRDEPFNFGNFAAEFIALAAVVAQFIPGVPKDIISKASVALNKWRTTGVVDVSAVMDCALAIAPESLRKSEYVSKGTKVYSALANRDYVSAASQIGINIPGMLSEFQKTCDWTAISKTAKIGFDGAISSLQNMLNADAVNKLAGGLRSGQLIMDTISGQSITTVKQFQDVILGGINPQTVMTLIPQPYAIAKTLLNETADITSIDEFRAVVGLGNGIAVGDNVFDSLSIKAIAARVEDTIASRYSAGIKDLQYSLSTSIEEAKREYFATEVSKRTGAQILTNASGVNTTSNIRKAAPYIAIGALAVGATYFYSQKQM